MPTVLDYLIFRGDLHFSKDRFNDVDNLICALISYMDFSKIASPEKGGEILLSDAVAAYFSEDSGKPTYLGAVIPPQILDLAKSAASCARFSKTRLSMYRNVQKAAQGGESEVQWSALTMLFEDHSGYISFAGTNDTLISWKEDLDLAILDRIPSQYEAALYAASVFDAYPDYKFRIGGHSKGGNLALYAAASLEGEKRERVIRVYDNDGPGFSESFLRSEGYRAIRSKARNILPEMSVVGLLLERDLPVLVVKSSEKGLMQHNGMSWQVRGGRFERAEEPAPGALLLQRTMKKWLSTLNDVEKREFVGIIYKLLTSSNAETLTDIAADRTFLFSAYRKLPQNERKALRSTLAKFIHSGRQVMNEADAKRNAAKRTEKNEKKKKNRRFVLKIDGAEIYGGKTKKREKK